MSKQILPNKVYDVLKWIAMVFFPTFETLWLTLGNIWNFPYTVEIGATIAAVGLFIGGLLGISSIQYNRNKEGESDE